MKLGQDIVALQARLTLNKKLVPKQKYKLPILAWDKNFSQDIWDNQTKEFETNFISIIEINTKSLFSKEDYGIKIEEHFANSFFSPGQIAVFSAGTSLEKALRQIIFMGIQNQLPTLAQVVKNDRSLSSNSSSTGHEKSIPKNRKSFMTPTPLHIPESVISPIPQSTHEMLFYKNLQSPRQLKTTPINEIIWLHPLNCIVSA